MIDIRLAKRCQFVGQESCVVESVETIYSGYFLQRKMTRFNC